MKNMYDFSDSLKTLLLTVIFRMKTNGYKNRSFLKRVKYAWSQKHSEKRGKRQKSDRWRKRKNRQEKLKKGRGSITLSDHGGQIRRAWNNRRDDLQGKQQTPCIDEETTGFFTKKLQLIDSD